MRLFCPWPFCKDEDKPNFADFQRKTPQEIPSKWLQIIALLLPRNSSTWDCTGCGAVSCWERKRGPLKPITSQQTAVHLQVDKTAFYFCFFIVIRYCHIKKSVPLQHTISRLYVRKWEELIQHLILWITPKKQTKNKEQRKDSPTRRFQTSNILFF